MDGETLDTTRGFGSVTHDGVTIESNTETADEIRTALGIEAPVVEPETPAVEAKGKPRNDPRARVEQATATAAEAKRERDEAKAETARLNARIAELEAKSKPEPAKAPAAKPAGDPEPTVDQFDTYELFVDARARWAARQEWDSREQQRTEHETLQRREHVNREMDRKFAEDYHKILAEEPDFESRVDPRLLNVPRLSALADPSEATFGNFLVERVFKATHKKEMLLHLSNLETVQRLATLPADEVIGELAYFDRSIGAASPGGPAPTPPAVSKAKPPIQPLGSSHVASADDGPPGDDATDDEWFKWKDRQKRTKKRA